MSQTLKLYFNQSNFTDFIDKIKDLTKISDIVKVKIDNESIFMYSILGENIVLAFKNYEMQTSDYFDLKSEINYTLNIIITNAKKFVKNLQFIKLNEKIEMNIIHKPDEDGNSEARTVKIQNGKFKLQIETGETSEIRDIQKEQLDKRLDLKNKNWEFNITNSDFLDIKSLANINSDDSRRILHINVEDFKVKVSEKQLWELEVDQTTEEDKHLMINKKYLSSINDDGKDVIFHVFETFILIKDKISQLMISFEQDFSN